MWRLSPSTLALALTVAVILGVRPGNAQNPVPTVPVPAAPKKQADALAGETVEFHYDGKDVGHAERAWWGRAYVHPSVDPKKPAPLVVFLHGLNAALIKYRWMGNGGEGDVRRMVSDLIDQGKLPPVIVAAPSSIVSSQVAKGASWNHLDHDKFVAQTKSALSGKALVDPSRIVVVGHSGAGCSALGGLATLGDAQTKWKAAVAVDTCMSGDLAQRLASLPTDTDVVVTYQTSTWSTRSFALFADVFRKTAASTVGSGLAGAPVRTVEQLHPTRDPHNQTVALTLQKWLPEILRR